MHQLKDKDYAENAILKALPKLAWILLRHFLLTASPARSIRPISACRF
jgi:hypothetical protein